MNDTDLVTQIREERRWFEKSQLIFLYHSFREMGAKRPNKHTMRMTADELDLSVGYISEALKLSKAYPDTINITREEALRLIK